MRSRLFACVRARLHPRDVFSRRPTDYRPVASAKTRQLSAVAVVAFPLRHMLLSTNRAHSIGQHNTVFAHLIVSCVGCRVPYACLRFVCGACNTIITCRSGEMGRGWAFHGPPPSRHSLSRPGSVHTGPRRNSSTTLWRTPERSRNNPKTHPHYFFICPLLSRCPGVPVYSSFAPWCPGVQEATVARLGLFGSAMRACPGVLTGTLWLRDASGVRLDLSAFAARLY